MIRINLRNTIFKEMTIALSAYEKYSAIEFGTLTINQIFIDDINGIPIIPYYDSAAIIAENSNIIIIDMITEGYNITNHFLSYPKHKKYILFSNGWWDSSIDLGIDYILVHWNYFLYDYIKRLTSSNILDYFQNIQYEYFEPKEFIFSSLIGSKRIWRDKLVNLIENNIQFDNYILNYAGDELNQSSRHLDINYNFEKFNSYTKIIDHYSISSSIPIRLYNKTKILLIVETTCEDINEFHLTEKTIKVLLSGMPFIVVGSYNFLKHLHDLGFKTFDKIWSEEYDDIKNSDDRLTEIVMLLNWISKMEWNNQLIDQFKEISYYNKSQLLNANSIMKKQLETIVKDLKDF